MTTRTKRSSWIAAGAFAAVLMAAASPAYAWGYGHVGYFRPHFGFRAPHVSVYVGAPYYGYSYPYPYYGYPYPYSYVYTGYPYPYPYPYAVYPYARYRYARPYYRYPYRGYYPHRIQPRVAPYGHRY